MLKKQCSAPPPPIKFLQKTYTHLLKKKEVFMTLYCSFVINLKFSCSVVKFLGAQLKEIKGIEVLIK